VILYAMVTGRLPFDDDNIQRLLLKVQAGQFHLPPDMSEDLRSLIRSMLTVDPDERITLEGIKVHPWFMAVPPRSYPRDDFEPSAGPIVHPDIRVVSSLSDLGWGDIATITEHLSCAGSSMEKVFYQQLKRHPMFNRGHGSLPRANTQVPSHVQSSQEQGQQISSTPGITAAGVASGLGASNVSANTAPPVTSFSNANSVRVSTGADANDVAGSLAGVNIAETQEGSSVGLGGPSRVSSSVSWQGPAMSDSIDMRVGPTGPANLVRQSQLVRSSTDASAKQDDDTSVADAIEKQGAEQKSWFDSVRKYITGHGDQDESLGGSEQADNPSFSANPSS
jgi:serine/threonine protein kinase